MMRNLPLVLCATFAVAGCGANDTVSFPKNQAFKDLQARLQIDRTSRESPQATSRPGLRTPNREAAYFLRSHHERWTVAEAATYALVRIGEPAVAQMRQELKFADVNRQLKAIDILARIGPEAKAAVPDLIRMLKTGDERVKKYAARALGQIGPPAGPAVPELIKALNLPPLTP